MRPLILAAGSICHLRVIINGILQLDTGCKCNEIADEGIVDAHSGFFHLDYVSDHPARVDHGIMMGLLQCCQRNLVMLLTSFHEQDEGMMPGVINIRLAVLESVRTDNIVWLNIEFGKMPRQKSMGVGEAHSEHGGEIPPPCSDVNKLLLEISEVQILVLFHSLISNSIRRLSIVACTESLLQKGMGTGEFSSNPSMRALCHMSRSIMLQETRSKDPARNMSPGDVGNVISLDPGEPSGLAGAPCIRES